MGSAFRSGRLSGLLSPPESVMISAGRAFRCDISGLWVRPSVSKYLFLPWPRCRTVRHLFRCGEYWWRLSLLDIQIVLFPQTRQPRTNQPPTYRHVDLMTYLVHVPKRRCHHRTHPQLRVTFLTPLPLPSHHVSVALPPDRVDVAAFVCDTHTPR